MTADGGVLVLFAHPSVETSRVNRAMLEGVRSLDGVTVTDLYETYPDFDVDVGREQASAEQHAALVFQHPVYWYNAPALLKEWIDVVLTHGWAFGNGGTALHGKRLLSAVTAAGGREGYNRDDGRRHSLSELFAPFHQTAHYCGMTYLEPFVLHESHHADDRAIDAHVTRYRARIEALRDGAG